MSGSRAPFYGWRVVAVCFVAAVFTWGLGTFGNSIYLSEVTRAQGWSVSLVSGAITLFYLTSALSQAVVASAIGRLGPRPVFLFGTVSLALGAAAMGQVSAPWQLYAAFLVLGAGYSCLAVTGLSATIAPWFERHQGRSVAMALTGASVGAMVVVPLLALAIQRLGFAMAVLAGGCLAVAVLVPLSWVVLRYRGPHELGLGPDGDPPAAPGGEGASAAAPQWTRAQALATPALWTVAVGFALGLIVQVGFLTHHIKIAELALGRAGAGWLVGATGFAGLLGRLLLARVIDQRDPRRYTAAVLATQAAVLAAIALMPTAAVLIAASLVYGFCLGQITTLTPIVVRREFGAASYAAIYSVAGLVVQLSSAFGPTLYGMLRDGFGGYGPVLLIASGVELAAMATLLAAPPPRRA